MLRDLPRPCARYRTPARPKRIALQHGLRRRHRMPACGGHRHRYRPQVVLGTTTVARCGHDGRGRRRFLHVEGIGMKGASALRMRARTVAVLALTFGCAPAEAHLNATGMGPIYDGLMHFLLSPEDLVPALALALLAGLRGAPFGRRAMFTLPAAWLMGSLFGLSAAVASAGTLGASLWL